MSNVQIPAELYIAIVRYFLITPEDEDTLNTLWNTITSGLNAKLETQVRRELFSKYKRAATPEEREQARVAYLDHIGMRESFRSDTPPEPPI